MTEGGGGMLYDDMKGARVVIVLVMFRKMKGDVCFVLWFRVSIFCRYARACTLTNLFKCEVHSCFFLLLPQ